MLIDTTYIKNNYRIAVDDTILTESINSGSAWVVTKISKPVENMASTPDNKYTINLGANQYFFDRNLDDEVDVSGVPSTFADFTIFEVDENYNKYDLLSHITGIKELYVKGKNMLIIEMDGNYPSATGRIVYIKYRTSRLNYRSVDNEHKKQLVKKFIGYATIIDLLTNKRGALLQAGINSWNMNGVSVSIDDVGVENLLKYYKGEMKAVYDAMMPIVTDGINQRYNWTDRRFRN